LRKQRITHGRRDRTGHQRITGRIKPASALRNVCVRSGRVAIQYLPIFGRGWMPPAHDTIVSGTRWGEVAAPINAFAYRSVAVHGNWAIAGLRTTTLGQGDAKLRVFSVHRYIAGLDRASRPSIYVLITV